MSKPLELSEFFSRVQEGQSESAQSRADTLETNETERHLGHQSEGPRDPSTPVSLLRSQRSSWIAQLTKQRFCLLKVHGVEALREPIVDT